MVAKAEPDSLAFLLRVDDAINWEGMGKPEGVASRVSLPVERIVRCKEHDLAAIVLRADDLTGFRMQFCELPKQLAKSRRAYRPMDHLARQIQADFYSVPMSLQESFAI